MHSPCPPSGSWPVRMYAYPERLQGYGWKYALGFFPKLSVERFHPPKQSIVSTCTDCVQNDVYNTTMEAFRHKTQNYKDFTIKLES